MNTLFTTLAGMLRLRSGPQHLPASWPLTAVFIAMYLGEGIVTGQQLPGEENVARTLLSSVTQFVAVVLMLRFRRCPERLPQTLLALAATGFVLGLIAFGLLVQADPERNQPLLAAGWFLIFAWSLAVDGNIYRHALSIPMAQGVLVSVGLLAITYVIMQLVFMAPT